MVDEDHVTARLRELRDWADYIFESLTEDQRYERGKIRTLERLLPADDLGSVREQARRLADRLNELVARTTDCVAAR
jgi:ubiquinone biosynthesis protein UbiJ